MFGEGLNNEGGDTLVKKVFFLVGCNCSEAGQQLTSHPCTCYLGVENLSIVLINLYNTGFLSLFISHTLMSLHFLTQIFILFLLFQQLEDDRRRSEEQRHRHEMAEREHEKARKREEYLSSMGRTGRSTQGVINANFVHMPEEKKNKICQKDLRHQERVLRDSCLVMGRVNEYFLA